MKKKIITFIFISLILSLFTGCTKININNPPPDESNNSITENTPNINDSSNTTNENKPSTNNSDNVNPSKEPITVEKKVRLFYYDVIDDKVVYIDQNISIKNKAVATALINALKHPSNNNVTAAIASTINVKSATIDNNTSTLKIDFSENFVKAQNLGSGPEAGTLKAIVNTLGYNFNVKNVLITINGKPYSSGHILMDEGESFKVDYNNIEELVIK